MDRDTTKFTVPDLKEGLEYYFRVTALNDEGESKPLESVDTAKPKKKIGELIPGIYVAISFIDTVLSAFFLVWHFFSSVKNKRMLIRDT